LVVGLAGTVGVPASSATTDVWFNGGGCCDQYIAAGYPWGVGAAHSLTANNAYVLSDICVGAIDVYGGGLSGAGTCGNFPWTWVGHPYCGCVLRDPVVYPYVGTGGVLHYATESY
jgi:hypothetical protein